MVAQMDRLKFIKTPLHEILSDAESMQRLDNDEEVKNDMLLQIPDGCHDRFVLDMMEMRTVWLVSSPFVLGPLGCRVFQAFLVIKREPYSKTVKYGAYS